MSVCFSSASQFLSSQNANTYSLHQWDFMTQLSDIKGGIFKFKRKSGDTGNIYLGQSIFKTSLPHTLATVQISSPTFI